MKRIVCMPIVLAAISLQALELTPSGWEIVIPDRDEEGVHANLWGLTERFARDLAESTGVALPIRFASKETRPGHAIYVGGGFAERAGLLPADMKGLSNGIAEKDGNLYFFGRDRAGRRWKKGEWPGQNRMILPSARAMTRFMRKFMGVRFAMPGENGRAVPKRAKLVVPDGYRDREDPAFDYMAGSAFTGLAAIGRGHFGPGAYHTYGGHTYPAALPRELFKEHPEYFALRGGKRVLGATFGHTAACISNPGARRRILDEVLARFDDGAEVCQLAQNDGDASCQCGKCRALYGTGDDWGEKLWLFHRDLAEEIARLRPGKIVHILSYGQTANPPKSFRRFPSNVMVELCSCSEESFRRWKDYDVPHGFTVYLYLWGNYPPPGFTPKRSFAGLAALVRRLRVNRVRGVFRCGFGELPGMEGPAYYYFDRLLEDPDAPIEATLEEFCSAAFGREAAEPMKRFYETLDSRLRAFDAMSTGHFEADAPGQSRYLKIVPSRTLDLLAYFYTPETLNAMEGCLRRAENAALSEKERIRLGRVRLEFGYAKNLGRIATLYAGYLANPSKAAFQPLAEELRWRKAFLDRVFDEKGASRRLEGWPESPLFGGNPRAMVETNGRLGAVIGAPLDWDVERMLAEEHYPGSAEGVVKRKTYNAARGLKYLTNFRPYPKDLKVDLEVRPDGRGFKVRTVPGVKDTRIVATGLADTGKLRPNATYRVSWFARFTDVTAPSRKEGGFCCLVQAGPGLAFSEPALTSGLTGCSDWRHMSKTFTTRADKPWDACETIFRLYDSQGELEVEDVTVEEVR